MLNLSVNLEESARRWPDRPALVLGSKETTYRELDEQSSACAAALSRCGVGRGERVALSCPNLPEFAIAYYGVLKAGAIVVPLNVLLKANEIAHHLRDTEASAYLCFEGSESLPMAREGAAAVREVPSCRTFVVIPADDRAQGGRDPLPDGREALGWSQFLARAESSRTPVAGGFDGKAAATDPQDTAVILYTSGTTGKPKGAELSHFNLWMNAWVSTMLVGLRPADVELLVLPMFHSFGQTVQMNASVLAGATIVLLPRFDPAAVWKAMQERGVTIFAGVPTMYWALLHHEVPEGVDPEAVARTLRVCVSGGAAMPVEVLREFESRFRVTILEGYGLSETSPAACFNHLDRERKVGSIGTPVWGISMRIADEHGRDVAPGDPGEVLIRGHNVMKGYFRNPEATRDAIRDGWLRTGDVGRMDEDGYFYIVDRTKDMILRGGYNVYPREIEETMQEHPGVSLVAVVGIPDDELGEEIKAFVVPTGDPPVTETELVAWCKERMAAYKYPRLVEFRPELPMTATGKVKKRELR